METLYLPLILKLVFNYKWTKNKSLSLPLVTRDSSWLEKEVDSGKVSPWRARVILGEESETRDGFLITCFLIFLPFFFDICFLGREGEQIWFFWRKKMNTRFMGKRKRERVSFICFGGVWGVWDIFFLNVSFFFYKRIY